MPEMQVGATEGEKMLYSRCSALLGVCSTSRVHALCTHILRNSCGTTSQKVSLNTKMTRSWITLSQQTLFATTKTLNQLLMLAILTTHQIPSLLLSIVASDFKPNYKTIPQLLPTKPRRDALRECTMHMECTSLASGVR